MSDDDIKWDALAWRILEGNLGNCWRLPCPPTSRSPRRRSHTGHGSVCQHGQRAVRHAATCDTTLCFRATAIDNWIQLNFEVHVGGNLGIIQILTNTHKQHQITFKYPNIWWLILVSNHLIAGVPNLDTNQWMQSAAASPTYGQLPLVRGHVQPQFPRQLFFPAQVYSYRTMMLYIYYVIIYI